MSSNLIQVISEGDVLSGVDHAANTAVMEAKRKGMISSTMGHGIELGYSLCMYYAATRPNNGPPSAMLSHDTGASKCLQSSTCPPGFRSFFERWAAIVSQIRELTPQQKDQLERAICDQPRASASPERGRDPCHSPAPLSVSPEVCEIAQRLTAFGREISACRANYNQSSHQKVTPPNFSGGSIDAPRYSPRLGPIRMPEPKVQSSSSFDPQRISMPHSPRNSPSPIAHAKRYSQSGDMISPGSTNNQGVFIGGFVKPTRQASANTSESPVFPVPQIPKFTDSVDNNALIDNYSGVSGNQIGRPSGQVLPVKPATPIGTETSASGILAQLCSHGCQDLSNSLDRSTISARPVSRGGFGEVYSGKLFDGLTIALKVITMPEHYDDPKHLKHAARELYTWSKCQHRNVVPLLGLVEFDSRIAMVSLWLENGNLRKYVNSNPAADRLSLCIQIAMGLEYLHSLEIVHGDLKGPNILVSGDGVPMLIDFGNATLAESTLQFTQTVTKHDITPRWAAPELLRNAKPSTESDVYALGMTVLETLTGDVPYAGVRDNAILYTIGKLMELPDRPKKHIPETPWGDTLWLLLTECWEGDPGIRPKATDVRQRLEKIFEERQRR